MPRVKRGTMHLKRRKSILKRTKGYLGGRKNRIRAANEANIKAEKYAYRDRRNKKREMRRLWNIRINAGTRLYGMSYSVFINALKNANIQLDRKVLSTLAAEKPAIFKQIVEQVKK